MGSDDSLVVWLNGSLVLAVEACRPYGPNQDTVRVTLKSGWNRILTQTQNGGGGWGMLFRITDLSENGLPLPYRISPPPDGGDACDNCDATWNLDQHDSNNNGLGDVCDANDADRDSVRDLADNCPFDYNPSQRVAEVRPGDYYDFDDFESGPLGTADRWSLYAGTLAPIITKETAFRGSYSLRMQASAARNFEDAQVETQQAAGGYAVDLYPSLCMAYRIPPGTSVRAKLKIDATWYAMSVDAADSPVLSADVVARFGPVLMDNEWHYRCTNIREQLRTAGLFNAITKVQGIVFETGLGTSPQGGTWWLDDFSIGTETELVGSVCDNCPTRINLDQADFDDDGIGDVCDDSDGDGVIDAVDNCRLISNTNQADTDADGIADACWRSYVGPHDDPVATGSGADGDVTISDWVDFSTTTVASGRSCTDGGDMVAYSVVGLTSLEATLSDAPATGCLNAGDDVLLMNVQGAPLEGVNVGVYEILQVLTVNGTLVEFSTPKARYYGTDVGSDDDVGTGANEQRVILQRVPNYNNVTLGEGASATASAWNTTVGGVFAFRAKGHVWLGGTIDMHGKGYRGGATDSTASAMGQAGEGIVGIGALQSEFNRNGGGGGAGQDTGGCSTNGYSGGGGSNVTAGTNGSLTCSGDSGEAVADPLLDRWYLGGGGGSGGNASDLSENPPGGYGGAGGGVVLIVADTIEVSDTGLVDATGAVGQGDTTEGCSGASTSDCWDTSGPGGGGAGGTIWLVAHALSFADSTVRANGGAGGLGGAAGNGGKGGDGRIGIESSTAPLGTAFPGASIRRVAP